MTTRFIPKETITLKSITLHAIRDIVTKKVFA